MTTQFLLLTAPAFHKGKPCSDLVGEIQRKINAGFHLHGCVTPFNGPDGYTWFMRALIKEAK